MNVVEVQIRFEPTFAFIRAVVSEPIRPFAKKRLDDALDLAVGPWRVVSSPEVSHGKTSAQCTKGVRDKRRTVVGHDALDLHAVSMEPDDSSSEEDGSR